MVINTVLILIAITCIVLIMLISITENGLLAISKSRVKQLVKHGIKKAEIVEKLRSRNYNLSAAIIILNGLLTIIFSLAIFVLAIKLYGFELVTLLVASFIDIFIAVFIYINARTIAVRNPEKTAFFFIKNLFVIINLLNPLISVLTGISGVILRIFGIKKVILPKVVDRTVRDIMIPRSEVIAVSQNSGIVDVLDIIIKQYHNRIPVYSEDIDNIIGMVNIKDVLKAVKDRNMDKTVKDIIKSINYIPESHKISDLLTEFQQYRLHMAVVVDEYGGTSGIVTMEDLLDEIAGYKVEKISECEAIMNARTSIDDLNEVFEVEIESNGYDSVGSLVLDKLGTVANVGDEIQVGEIKIAVLSTIGRRIKDIKVTRSEGKGHVDEKTK